MKNLPATSAPAAAAYAAYLTTIQARPAAPAAQQAAALADLARVITEAAEAGLPGSGREIDSGERTKAGQPITRSGMKPGTPFALIARRSGRRTEICQVWPCGALDSAGPACFSI